MIEICSGRHPCEAKCRGRRPRRPDKRNILKYYNLWALEYQLSFLWEGRRPRRPVLLGFGILFAISVMHDAFPVLYTI